MNRRKFIKGAAVAGGATAVAASTFPAPAIAQKRIEISKQMLKEREVAAREGRVQQ
mgnify:CR=1 FL=1